MMMSGIRTPSSSETRSREPTSNVPLSVRSFCERRAIYVGRSHASTGASLPAGPTVIHRGDLHWLADEVTRRPVPGHAHPHVVVQEDVFNHSRIATVVVCALTSNLAKAPEPGNVLLEAGEGALPRRSVVVVSQIEAIAKTRLGPRIGALSAARVDQVLDGLGFLQRAFFDRR